MRKQIFLDGKPSPYWITEEGLLWSDRLGRYLKRNGRYYLKVNLGEKRTVYIHHLVAEYFLEKPKDLDEYQINHKDGNPLNNHKDNLEYVSSQENLAHQKEMRAYGENKHVHMYDNLGNFVRTFKTLKDAEKFAKEKREKEIVSFALNNSPYSTGNFFWIRGQKAESFDFSKEYDNSIKEKEISHFTEELYLVLELEGIKKYYKSYSEAERKSIEDFGQKLTRSSISKAYKGLLTSRAPLIYSRLTIHWEYNSL